VELDRGVFRQGVFERAERREKKRGRGPGQWVTVAAPCPGTFQAQKKTGESSNPLPWDSTHREGGEGGGV